MFSGVVRPIANHLPLTIFESTPEVRVLSSAGVTRPQQSYDPVRLPSEPSPDSDVEAATLAQSGSPLITCVTFPTCRAHYPGGSNGCVGRLLSRSRGLPRNDGGAASPFGISGPARTSLVLRPAELLDRPWRPLSRGFNPDGCPSKPLVSYRSNRQLSGWLLPPLATHAYRAHLIRSPRKGDRPQPVSAVAVANNRSRHYLPAGRNP